MKNQKITLHPVVSEPKESQSDTAECTVGELPVPSNRSGPEGWEMVNVSKSFVMAAAVAMIAGCAADDGSNQSPGSTIITGTGGAPTGVNTVTPGGTNT